MNRNMNNKAIWFQYRFKFGEGGEKLFDVRLNRETLNLIKSKRELYPEWVNLSFFKCLTCPLEEVHYPYCPIAANLIELVDFFRDMISYEEVDLEIHCEERTYCKHTTLQQGISSLVGIYMVTSGCPIMEKLKPMVRYHLPFATRIETQYRVLSMYLMAQFFIYRKGREPDWELKNLVKIYDDIQVVNNDFCRRLAQNQMGDAALNALVKLDIFAKHVSSSINSDTLDEEERLFDAYL